MQRLLLLPMREDDGGGANRDLNMLSLLMTENCYCGRGGVL